MEASTGRATEKIAYTKPILCTLEPGSRADRQARGRLDGGRPARIGDGDTLSAADYDDLFPLDRPTRLAQDDRPGPGASEPAGLAVLTLSEFKAQPAPEFLIEGVLPEGVTVVAGQPGAAKSFLASAIASAVARGCPLFGRSEFQVNQPGPVLVALPEAFKSHAGRLRAFDAYHGFDDDADLFFCRDGIDLHDEDAWARLVATVDNIGRGLEDTVALVVVDTLAAATPGANENAGEDMAAVMARCQSLVARGTNVLLTHHLSKGGSEFRGHTSILGSCDAMLYLTHDRESGVRELVARKLRDADRIAPVAFEITSTEFGPVPVAADAKGPWTTFYEACDEWPGLLDAFRDLGMMTPDAETRPCRGADLLKGATLRDLQSRWNETAPPKASGSRTVRAVRMQRTRKLIAVVKALQGAGIVAVKSGRLSGSEADALACTVIQPALESHGYTP